MQINSGFGIGGGIGVYSPTSGINPYDAGFGMHTSANTGTNDNIDDEIDDEINNDDTQNGINEGGDKKGGAAEIQQYFTKRKHENVVDPKSGYEHDNDMKWDLPNYGLSQFINDRFMWMSQHNILGADSGWFYFKVFFKFDTNYGLFGNIFNSTPTSSPIKNLYSGNSAYPFLYFNRRFHKKYNIPDRIRALFKFATTLKSITAETPWLIKGVNGLDNVMPNFAIDVSNNDRSIELLFSDETVDARIGTMFDMYKYACFDDINCIDIIPANLRKFKMYVMLYANPTKAFDNKWYSKNDKTNSGKTTHINAASELNNMFSFKMYTFDNCEIDIQGLNRYIGSSLSNEQAFRMGNNTLKIFYDRVYETRMNEWAEFFMGSPGFFYNKQAPIDTIGDIPINVGNTDAVSKERDAQLQSIYNITKHSILYNRIKKFDMTHDTGGEIESKSLMNDFIINLATEQANYRNNVTEATIESRFIIDNIVNKLKAQRMIGITI